MAVLIDHSIAHPRALAQMIETGGSYIADQQVKLEPMWRFAEADLWEADLIIANSDFVKQTLVDCGIPLERVAVLYWGVDSEMESYLEGLPRKRPPIEAGVKFLFAGSVERRKGADLLLKAFAELQQDDWQLTIAGPVQADLRQRVSALRDPRVRVLGPVSREELARLMLSHHVFVFPTLAEGSARVVFEAMAAGMAIVTTPNAGSVVEDRRHGLLIQAGSRQSTVDAVGAFLGPERERIMTYGRAADALIKREYHSGAYKAKLVALYRDIAGSP
jgi:glycosyltransferase involved in cell wall biosynthesis